MNDHETLELLFVHLLRPYERRREISSRELVGVALPGKSILTNDRPGLPFTYIIRLRECRKLLIIPPEVAIPPACQLSQVGRRPKHEDHA